MMRVDLVGWSLLLIALAMGYSVLIKAGKTDNKNLKMLGYVIGIIVLAACLVLVLSDLGSRIRLRRGAMVGPRRTTGTPARPFTAPNINMPAIPRAPKSAIETVPAVPNIPNPPAAPKVQ